MSKYVIDSSTLVSIGDAVREKDGTTAPIVVSDLASRIKAIETGGGGGGELPAEALVISGNCANRFCYDGWSWYINTFGDKITTKDISNCSSMFYKNGSNLLTTIPFDININKSCNTMGYMFSESAYLTKIPLVLAQEDIPPPTSAYSGMIDVGYIFYSCYRLREIPYEFFNNIINQAHFEKAMTINGGNRSGIFGYCHALRKLPDLSRVPTGQTSVYSCFYYNAFKNCQSLDEIIDLPVIPVNYTSNAFGDTFHTTGRVKNITFKTNEDGSPIAVTWKNQTITLTNNVGYENNINFIVNYNSGITADKEVKDDATYQALKNDEDWFTLNNDYSRYNHDSAVATINSLPDVSAGSGNTIKFKGAQGALTDGGAINTMTEEEIAVAAAKGWTVTLV